MKMIPLLLIITAAVPVFADEDLLGRLKLLSPDSGAAAPDEPRLRGLDGKPVAPATLRGLDGKPVAPATLRGLDGKPVAPASLRGLDGRPLAPDDPRARLKSLPAAAAGRIFLTAGLQTTITTKKGDVFLEVSPDIEAPLKDLHARRAAAMKSDTASFMEQDAEHAAAPPNEHGETASLLVAAHRNGNFVGGIVSTGSKYQPWQVWAYSLKNDKGDNRRVVITAGHLNGEGAICARYYAADNKETDRVVFLAMDTKTESVDKGFRSTCN